MPRIPFALPVPTPTVDQVARALLREDRDLPIRVAFAAAVEWIANPDRGPLCLHEEF